MQTKEEIHKELTQLYNEFIKTIESLTDEVYMLEKDGKWSVAEHTDHVYRATKPLIMGLNMVKFTLKFMFGKPPQEPRSYQEIVKLYDTKLGEGFKAAGDYIPKKRSLEERTERMEKFRNLANEFLTAIDSKWKDDELDSYAVPHPALGKMSIREILFFTHYHTGLHLKTIKSIQ